MKAKWIVIVALLVACRSKEDAPTAAPTAPVVAPSRPPATTVPADPLPTAREKLQQDIVDGLNAMFHGAGATSTATIDEDDLMIVDVKGACNRRALQQTRDALVALKLDPASAFTSMQCPSDGVMLKLH